MQQLDWKAGDSYRTKDGTVIRIDCVMALELRCIDTTEGV